MGDDKRSYIKFVKVDGGFTMWKNVRGTKEEQYGVARIPLKYFQAAEKLTDDQVKALEEIGECIIYEK